MQNRTREEWAKWLWEKATYRIKVEQFYEDADEILLALRSEREKAIEECRKENTRLLLRLIAADEVAKSAERLAEETDEQTGETDLNLLATLNGKLDVYLALDKLIPSPPSPGREEMCGTATHEWISPVFNAAMDRDFCRKCGQAKP